MPTFFTLAPIFVPLLEGTFLDGAWGFVMYYGLITVSSMSYAVMLLIVLKLVKKLWLTKGRMEGAVKNR